MKNYKEHLLRNWLEGEPNLSHEENVDTDTNFFGNLYGDMPSGRQRTWSTPQNRCMF